jgi:hypothetical protein
LTASLNDARFPVGIDPRPFNISNTLRFHK